MSKSEFVKLVLNRTNYNMGLHFKKFALSNYSDKQHLVYMFAENGVHTYMIFAMNSSKKTTAVELAWSNKDTDPTCIKFNVEYPKRAVAACEERIAAGFLLGNHQITWELFSPEDELYALGRKNDDVFRAIESSYQGVNLESLGIVRHSSSDKIAFYSSSSSGESYDVVEVLVYAAIDMLFSRVANSIHEYFERV